MQTKIRMAYRSDSSTWETATGKPDKPRGKLLVQLTETVPERGSDIIAPPSSFSPTAITRMPCVGFRFGCVSLAAPARILSDLYAQFLEV